MAFTRLRGYPQPQGAKIQVIGDLDGPASYPTGGVVFAPGTAGLKYIDWAECGLSSDGLNQVEPKVVTKGKITTVNLVWTVLATGAQVANATNLSAVFVRIQLLGG